MHHKFLILKIFIFLILLTLCVYPFWYPGIWAYLDVDIFGRMIVAPQDIFHFPFQSFTRSGSYFGADNSNYNASLFGHLSIYNFLYAFLSLKGVQIIVFIGVFFINFFLGYKLAGLTLIRNNTNHIDRDLAQYLGGLLVAFNPIALWSLWNSGYVFMYSAFLLIFLSMYPIFFTKDTHWYNYFFIVLGGYFLIAYPRMGYVLFFVIVGLFSLFAFKNENISFKKIGILGSIIILSPIFYMNISENFRSGQGLIGYFNTQFSDWYDIIYSIVQNGRGLETFSIFPPHELKMLYAQEGWVSVVIGSIITSWIIIFLLLRIYKKYTIFWIFTLLSTSLGMFLIQNLVPIFNITQETHTVLAKTKIGFLLADPTTYRIILIIPTIIVFVGLIAYSKHMLIRGYMILSIIVLMLVSVYPVSTPNIQGKMQGLSQAYFRDTLRDFYQIQENFPTYFPEKAIYLLHQGLQYPFKTLYLTGYKPIFSNNPRVGGAKQILLYYKLDTANLPQSRIFNIKNSIVFHNLVNVKPGEFDFFPAKDYIGDSIRFYQELAYNTGVYIKQENENFTHFGLEYDDSYEYFLYSPASILRQDMNSFFSGSIDITQKPIVIDPDSFHQPQIVDTYEVPDENKNISLQYKSAVLEPTKIYTKITDFDSSKPFLLQLNQTFGMSWKVKWITKEEFEEKPCIDEYRQYPITQNAVCQYEATILDLRDTKYLDNPSVSEERHFEGNFVGNAWLVTPEDIPEDMRGQSELYAVIIYEKQIYYAWALVISGLTFLVLVVLSIREAIISYRRKKHE